MADDVKAQSSQGRAETIGHLPSLRGDSFRFQPQGVGRAYHIYVRLPEGHEEDDSRRYPVVYVLHGGATFPMLAPLHLLMHHDDQALEAILVGIAFGSFESSIKRRDVNFRLVMDDGNAGGAVRFLSMLEEELLPRIDRQWRTDPERRVAVGQSRGGSAALQTAWLKPGLFCGHVASNSASEPYTKLLFGMDRAPPQKILVRGVGFARPRLSSQDPTAMEG